MINESETPQTLGGSVFEHESDIDLIVPCTAIAKYIEEWPVLKSISGPHDIGEDGICKKCGSNYIEYTAIGEVPCNEEFYDKDGNKLSYTITYDEVTKHGTIMFTGKLGSIGENAFWSCDNLKSITIPNSVTSMGDYAFQWCNNLTNLTLKTIPSFGSEVFDGTPANMTITLDLSDDSDINEGGNSNMPDFSSASYTRSIKANWNTICLPFDAKSTEDTKFYVIGNLENGVITLQLAETLPAGTPALVYTTGNTKLDIKASNAAINTTVANADGTNRLVGTFKNATVPGASDASHLFYGLSANKGTYVKVSSDVALKPFRAYIECENTASNAAGLRQLVAEEDIDATAISDVITTLSDSETEYFDMNGRKIAGLQKGMNIVKKDGKVTKVLIK